MLNKMQVSSSSDIFCIGYMIAGSKMLTKLLFFFKIRSRSTQIDI